MTTFRSFAEVMNDLLDHENEPLQFVRYLGQVTAGDKRIVVVDGEIYGAYLRKSQDGHWVQNVSLGSHCTLSVATMQERRIIAATQGHYRNEGLHVLGYDFLRDDDGHAKLSEINAGNIGGLARLEQLGKSGAMNRFVNWLHGQKVREITALLGSYTSYNRFMPAAHSP